MGEVPVTALARSRQLPKQVAPPRLHRALALRHPPTFLAFLAFLDPPLVVIVGRVIGAALPVEVTLQPSQRFRVRGHLGAEGLQQHCSSAACSATTAMVVGPKSSPTIPVPSCCCGLRHAIPW